MSCATMMLLLNAAPADLSLAVPPTPRAELRAMPTRRCKQGELYGDFVDLEGKVHPFSEVRALLMADPDARPYLVQWEAEEQWRRNQFAGLVTPVGYVYSFIHGFVLYKRVGGYVDGFGDRDATLATAFRVYNSARNIEVMEQEVAGLHDGVGETPSAALLQTARLIREARGLDNGNLEADFYVLGLAVQGHDVDTLVIAAARATQAGYREVPLRDLLAIGLQLPEVVFEDP